MNGLNLYAQIGTLFMFVCSLIAGTTGYLNRKIHPYLRGIYLYPLASVCHAILFYLIGRFHIKGKIKGTIIYVNGDIFLFIEFFVIYYFFTKTLKNESVRKFLYLIEVVYIVMVLIFWFTFKSFSKLAINLYAPQAFFVLIPVTAYYLEFIKWPPPDKLSKIPSFWVVTGITIYFACTTPLFLMKDFIFKKEHLIEQNVFIINFIAYGIMFLFIAKAYLCPRRDVERFPIQ